MAANSISRETVRDAAATSLATALVGTGKPCQAVYGYNVGDFAGLSPVVVVMSGPTERVKNFSDQTYDAWVHLYFQSFVKRSMPDEDDAEDRLDLIEKTIADWMMDNSSTSAWDDSEYVGTTDPMDVKDEGGVDYLTEIIHVRFRKFQG